ncbi:MAG TPA: hypothetical protein VHA13_01640 [Gammaproteobacteria bacterium]|nr:hypothetical protein [Gammaproteobacteria bacterium]
MIRKDLWKVIEKNAYDLEAEQAIKTAVDSYSSALLQQTDVSGSLVLLDELLIKEQELHDRTINDSVKYGAMQNIAAIKAVQIMIKGVLANDR